MATATRFDASLLYSVDDLLARAENGSDGGLIQKQRETVMSDLNVNKVETLRSAVEVAAQESMQDLVAWLKDGGFGEVQNLLDNLTACPEGIIGIGIENPLFIQRIRYLAQVALFEAMRLAATGDSVSRPSLPPQGSHMRDGNGNHRMNQWSTEMDDEPLGLIENQAKRLRAKYRNRKQRAAVAARKRRVAVA